MKLFFLLLFLIPSFAFAGLSVPSKGAIIGTTPGTVAAGNDGRFAADRDFTPASLSGLTYWLRGSDLSSLADGTTLTAGNLTDRSPNGFAVTVQGAPVKVTGVDGRTAIKFGYAAIIPGIILPSQFSIPLNACSVYVVARQGNRTSDINAAMLDFGSGFQSMFWLSGGALQLYNGNSNPYTRQTQLSQESFFTIGYRANPTATIFRYNDWQESKGAAGSATLTGGKIGVCASSNNFYFTGEIAEVIVFNRTLTDEEDAAVISYLKTPSLRTQIVCPGDSNTYGYSSALADNTLKSHGYPWKLQRRLPDYKIINLGVPSQTLATELGLVNSQVTPLFDASTFPGGNIVCFSDPGANDIANGATAASTYANLVTYCAAIHAAGGRIYISTILPRVSFSVGQEAVRQNYNGLIRVGWSNIAEGLVDLDANTPLGGVGTATNTIYFDGDGTHRTAAGNQKIASAFASAILTANAVNNLKTLLDAATVTLACNANLPNQTAAVTLGGNRALEITSASAGMRGTIIVTQDATGSRTLTLPSGSKVSGGGSGAVVLSTAAGAKDRLSWEYDGANYFWTVTLNFN